MIKVTLYHNNNKDIYRFSVSNHGEPIVCAGVSALVITCVNFIQAHFNHEIDLQMKDMQFIDFSVNELQQNKITHDTSLIINNMAYGLRLIAETYSDDIKIYEKFS